MKKSEKSTLPIGVFDSGLGGLTVLKELSKALPNENFVYLGDTARVPYGNKSISTIKNYSIDCTEFLMEQEVKMIVIACNTASALAYETVCKTAKGLPVVEMIVPASLDACSISVNGRIGVIGTKATIASMAYQNRIKQWRDFDNVNVFANACPLFVPLVEEAMWLHPASELIANEYLQPLIAENIDTLVLACTHYPFLTPLFHKLLPNINLVNTGTSASVSCKKILTEENMLNDSGGEYQFYVTDTPSDFLKIAQEYLSIPIENVKKVEIGY